MPKRFALKTFPLFEAYLQPNEPKCKLLVDLYENAYPVGNIRPALDVDLQINRFL